MNFQLIRTETLVTKQHEFKVDAGHNYHEKSSCRRQCTQRINKIYFEHGAAGIGDRLTALHMLAQMAGYLCADLELPPPYIHLNSVHNDGKQISDIIQWQDLRNMTFLPDNAPVFSARKTFEDNFTEWRKVPVYDAERDYPGWSHIVTRKDGDLLNDYLKVQDLSWAQKKGTKFGFIWEIHQSIYTSSLFDVGPPLPEPSHIVTEGTDFREDMRPYLLSFRHFRPDVIENIGCIYSDDSDKSSVPSHMQIIRNQLVETVKRVTGATLNSVFIYFHIRRGDAKNDCNTTMPAIEEYLSCSLNGTESLGKNLVIMMASDERDASYRKNVLHIGNSFDHVTMIDADNITSMVLTNAVKIEIIPTDMINNYYLFMVQQVLKYEGNLTALVLSKRRTDCKKCLPDLKRRMLSL
mmetsp:Transcript_30602/g.61166  ORF Transcript_30602/g.61166 Transcript_30602/m.61166 type:complete len:408 (+) Transcript_30602:102-1325(+)